MANNNQKNTIQESIQESRRYSKAKWTMSTTHTFCDICIQAIQKGMRPSTHFTVEGWQFVVSNFQRITSLTYDKGKLKNKWDLLKTEWKLWKELIGKETGLGWDPRLEMIDASTDWWDDKIKINKEYAKFRKKGLEPDLVTKNDVMFGSTVATGEFSWTPSSNCNVPLVSHPNSTDENVVDLNDSEDDAFEKSVEMFLNEDDDMSDGATTLGKRQRKGKGKLESQCNASENKPKKGKIQKGGVAAKLRSDISKLVASVEKKTTSEDGYTIKDAMDDLHNIPDIEKGQ
ncbi:uncharacterized protein LOC141710809 [Apium graveolens]|uniref:uncharacterized protein LOC141710809 n=1 Tax=Apium graveolens TaxID=4045 RepID=UPI003D799DF1